MRVGDKAGAKLMFNRKNPVFNSEIKWCLENNSQYRVI